MILKPGAKILSLGCGIGLMECWLAQQIQGQGEILATDISSEQLELAKKNAQGLSNIEFAQLNVLDLQFEQRFDVVYSRFLLSHLPDAKTVIKKMLNSLKPSGILWCEEMCNSRIFSSPSNPAVTMAIDIVNQLGKVFGFDADFGEKLYSVFHHYRLDNININISQPAYYQGAEKQLLFLSIKEAKEKIIHANIISETQFETLIKEVEDFTIKAETLMALTPIVQVVAYKPNTLVQ